MEVVSMTNPLVKVFRIIDGDKTPMGYIYEGMDRVKEDINTLYEGN
jgi:hypothetical protein